MPSSRVHHAAGCVLGAGLGWLILRSGGDVIYAGLLAAGSVAGSSAPDWLEIKCWLAGHRYSLIPHRTCTHWLLGWCMLTALAWMPSVEPLMWFVRGFTASCLVHVSMDFCTPMGVPVLLPTHRVSLFR